MLLVKTGFIQLKDSFFFLLLCFVLFFVFVVVFVFSLNAQYSMLQTTTTQLFLPRSLSG